MAIKRKGSTWFGENEEDIAAYLRAFQAGGYAVGQVRHVTCMVCGGTAFRVLVEADEGVAVTECLACHTATPVADSADHLDDTDVEECACPCGGESFDASLGYALTEDGEVRWISVGMRCLTDGRLGVYTDWQIDYEPSAHLLLPG